MTFLKAKQGTGRNQDSALCVELSFAENVFERLCDKPDGHLGSGLHLCKCKAGVVRWQLKPRSVDGSFLPAVAAAAAPGS